MRARQQRHGEVGSFEWGRRIVLTSACFLSVILAVPAQSAGDFIATDLSNQYSAYYAIALFNGAPNVTNLVLFEEGEGFSDTTRVTQSIVGSSALLSGISRGQPVQSALLLGLMNNASGNHVVMFSNISAGLNAQGVSWSTLFAHTDEAALITSLRDFTSGAAADAPERVSAALALDTFIQNDAKLGKLGANGTSGSAWFSMGNSFNAVAFSKGAMIGLGTSFQISAVPEPETYALMLAGLGLVGWTARRRVA